MTAYQHGLVLGKFYPPHAGHHHLVRIAQERCERLTVLVCASSAESVPLAERVAWMRAVHPDADVVGAVDDIPVDTTDPAVWDAHMAVFLAAVPEPVDAVFTSEAYGEELGRRLGAESTGTTTMARALTEHYRRRGGVWERTQCVPEYGREFSERKLAALRAQRPDADWADVAFSTEEFPLIAQRQSDDEETAAGAGSPVVFCDTDAFATTVWHERYLGGPHPDVARIAARGGQHLWLLTDHTGVPFEDDGLRDGEHLRPWMTGRFREELTRTERTFRTLRGTPEERLAVAVAAVDALLAEGWGFTDPLPEKR